MEFSLSDQSQDKVIIGSGGTGGFAQHAGVAPTERGGSVARLGVPMPLPVRSRRYNNEFWKQLMKGKEKRRKEQNLKELGF